MMRMGQGNKQEDKDTQGKNAQADREKKVEKLRKAGKAEAEHKGPKAHRRSERTSVQTSVSSTTAPLARRFSRAAEVHSTASPSAFS